MKPDFFLVMWKIKIYHNFDIYTVFSLSYGVAFQKVIYFVVNLELRPSTTFCSLFFENTGY